MLMRFLYYDKITKIEKGISISGNKSFSLSEEFLRGHFSKAALIPGAILIEAMAQLLGWLIIYSHNFSLTAIMSLVEDVSVSPQLRPGFTAHIQAEIISTSRHDSLGKASLYADGELIASMNRIIYSHFHDVNPKELAALFEYYSGMKVE